MGRMDLCDGKYTVINELESGGSFRALRYGEEWRDLAGDNLVLAFYQELEEAKAEVARLRRIIDEALKSSEWGAYDDSLRSVVRILKEVTVDDQ
jgi:hypothetical protein